MTINEPVKHYVPALKYRCLTYFYGELEDLVYPGVLSVTPYQTGSGVALWVDAALLVAGLFVPPCIERPCRLLNL